MIFAPPFASIALVNVDTPEVTIIPEAKVAIPINVEIPLTFNSVNVFGEFEIAVSNVAVVTASKDEIFLSPNVELKTSVTPIETEVAVATPLMLRLLPETLSNTKSS